MPNQSQLNTTPDMKMYCFSAGAKAWRNMQRSGQGLTYLKTAFELYASSVSNTTHILTKNLAELTLKKKEPAATIHT